MELNKIAQGEVVKLSPFISDEPFVVRLKRPSLLQLAASGKIPNPLLGVAEQLFNGNFSNSKQNIKETAEFLLLIAKNALVFPTFDELCEKEINLTDLQLIEIFNYTQMGVKALENFRGFKGSYENTDALHDI